MRYLLNTDDVIDYCSQDGEIIQVPEKKAWQALHGAWGKRPVKQAQFNSGNTYFLPDIFLDLFHLRRDDIKDLIFHL